MTIRPRRFAVAAVWALACAGFAADARTPPDLTGVWHVRGNIQQLRPVGGGEPPLLPEAKAVYETNRKAKASGDLQFDGTRVCMQAGMPRVLYQSKPFEILQRPWLTTFLFEFESSIRNVWMADKQPDLLLPSFMGQAIGHWEGDDLVVDTIGMKTGTVMDAEGLPHSDQLHLLERYHLRDGGRVLEDRIRVEDPGVFSAPWETVALFDRQKDGQIKEDVCPDRIGGLPKVKQYGLDE